MADIKWVKVATDIFSNRKIRQIEAMPEGDTMSLIWIKLICLAGQINDNGNIYITDGIPYTPESLSRELGRDSTVVHLALETFAKFNMIDCDEDGVIHITGWSEYQSVDGMERAKNRNRERQQKFRDKQKAKELGEGESNVMHNVTRNVTENVMDNVSITVSSYSPSPSISPSSSSSPSGSCTSPDSEVVDHMASASQEGNNLERDRIPDTPSTVQASTKSASHKKEPRKKYGEFQNVKLTDDDLAKLQEQFPDDWETRIERLSEYIAIKGDKYKNHLAVIRSWARRDVEECGRASPGASVFRHEPTHSQRIKDAMDEAMELLAGEPGEGAYCS